MFHKLFFKGLSGYKKMNKNKNKHEKVPIYLEQDFFYIYKYYYRDIWDLQRKYKEKSTKTNYKYPLLVYIKLIKWITFHRTSNSNLKLSGA